MFGMGMPELLLILVVALIVVGPRKLPDLAKGLGKGLRQFREATDEIKSGLQESEAYQDFQEAKSSFKDTVDSVNPKKLVDFDSVVESIDPIEPKKPKENLEGRKQLFEDIESEQKEAFAGLIEEDDKSVSSDKGGKGKGAPAKAAGDASGDSKSDA